MNFIILALPILLLVLGVIARLLFTAGEFTSIREVMRRPEMRSGAEISPLIAAFTLRFGIRYGVAFFIGGATWFFAAMAFVPDTTLGALLLFGPSAVLCAIGSMLIFLRIGCWSVGGLPLFGGK